MQGAKMLYESGRPTPPAVTFGKYELIEMIGHGGMAEVWKARMVGPAGFNRTVVVKRILPHLARDPQFAQMFVSEARLSARLTHPNIVQVFELGEFNGQYFLSMEYVRGRDLLHVMRMLQRSRSGPPPIELATVVVRDVCRALAYAHSLTTEEGAPLKIVHRDVTPSNVMVAYDGSAKLLDFGIAKALGAVGEAATRAGELKGKFAYMAPEQLETNRPVDHRADLFAAGVVLWEALTGARLFKGEHDGQTLMMVKEAVLEPPSTRNPKVIPELDRICMRALSRNVQERYPDGEQMAIDLDRVAHKMSCGAEDVKALVQTLFPSESSSGRVVAVTETDVPPSESVRIYTPVRPRRRIGLVLSGAVVVGAAIAGWVVVENRVGPNAAHAAATATMAPRAVPSTPPVATPAGTGGVRATAPAPLVIVSVRSTPARAEVFLDEETTPRGHTPLSLTLPRSNDVHQLTLKLPGFPLKMIPLRADTDAHIELALVQAPAAAPAAPPRPATAAARPAAVARPAPAAAPGRAPARVGDPRRLPHAPGDKPHEVNDADGEDVLDPFR